MAIFAEATARLLKNKYVCKVCKRAIKAPSMAVQQEKVKCRQCNSYRLRPKRKK